MKLTKKELAQINAMKYLLKHNPKKYKYYCHYNSMYNTWNYCLYNGHKEQMSLQVGG